jgi:hypothetical protein
MRGYAPWAPQAATRVWLDRILDVFDEYEDYRPLTARQVFYRLVATHGYPKTYNAVKRLEDWLSRARRARMIPFDWMRDDRIRGSDPGPQPFVEQPPDDWLADYLADLRLDWDRYGIRRSTGQPLRVELWCEAAGMHGQLERVAGRYDVPVFSGGGAESISARRGLVDRVVRQPDLPTVVLHVGDYDVDGTDIFAAFASDVQASLADDAPQAHITFQRVAVTPEQIAEHDLPTAVAKSTSDNQSRHQRIARWLAEGHGPGTAQAEALPPDVLASIVDEHLRQHIDFDVLADVERREREAHAWLHRRSRSASATDRSVDPQARPACLAGSFRAPGGTAPPADCAETSGGSLRVGWRLDERLARGRPLDEARVTPARTVEQ